jgi:hypothetical protein
MGRQVNFYMHPDEASAPGHRTAANAYCDPTPSPSAQASVRETTRRLPTASA